MFKGDLIPDSVAWEVLQRVACPTCSTTYGFRTGKYGLPLSRIGLSAFIGNLANTSTNGADFKDARVFNITTDECGPVFCSDANAAGVGDLAEVYRSRRKAEVC